MPAYIEFYGIPRQRAGRASLEVHGTTLAEILREAVEEIPALIECCHRDGTLKPGYIANQNGRAFLTDGQTPIAPGDTILLMSADAGG